MLCSGEQTVRSGVKAKSRGSGVWFEGGDAVIKISTELSAVEICQSEERICREPRLCETLTYLFL